MTEPSEFAFLPSQARDLRLPGPMPAVRRVQLADGLSALAWGEEPATIVALHGVALNAHTWDETVLCLAAASREASASILVLDLPGHGDSAWRADGDYSPQTLAAPVAHALDQALAAGLLAADFALVGHSLGGLIALAQQQLGLARFAQLVLVDILPLDPSAARTVAAFLDGPRWFASRDEIVQRALAFGFGGSRTSLERNVMLNTRTDSTGKVVWKHHLGVLGAKGLPASGSAQLWPVIAEPASSIDLILATTSMVDHGDVERFAALRPSARVVRIAGGHNLQEDSPAALAQVLAELLWN